MSSTAPPPDETPEERAERIRLDRFRDDTPEGLVIHHRPGEDEEEPEE